MIGQANADAEPVEDLGRLAALSDLKARPEQPCPTHPTNVDSAGQELHQECSAYLEYAIVIVGPGLPVPAMTQTSSAAHPVRDA